MLIVKAAVVLVPVCAIAWFVLDVKRKNLWGLLFGVLSIGLAGFVLWAGYQHGLSYQRTRVFQITDAAARALQAGKTEPVLDALQDFGSHRFDGSDFSHHQNQLRFKLDSLTKTNKTETGQQPPALDSSKAAAGLPRTSEE